MKSRLLILPIVLILLVSYTYLCVSRLIAGHTYESWMLSLAVFALMVGSQIMLRLPHRIGGSLIGRAITWAGALCIGFWSSFIIFSMLADLLYCLFLILRLFFNQTLHIDEIRVEELWHEALLILFFCSAGLTVAGLLQALSGPRVKRVSVPFANLPHGLQGLKIAQLSDIHVGATIRRGYIQKLVDRTLKLKADIIAVTGDIADGKPAELQPHLRPLADLKAPLGTYYITGNHEYYSGVELWLDEAKNLGFIPLINENRIVRYNGINLMVAGVTDISAHQFLPHHRSDPYKAIASADETSFKLLLAHQPESCVAAEAAGFDLQLSGHTHAGQFFPFNLLVKLAKRYYRGLHRYGKMWLYVNAGSGYWGAANRFAVPAEITLIELAAA